MPDITYRSQAPELMDDFSMKGPTLRGALDQIAKVNRRLGGNRATFQALRFIIRQWPEGKPLRITDIGCGSGDMLRALADWAPEGNPLVLHGIDANADTLAYARKLSRHYPEISFVKRDVLDGRPLPETDVVLVTLTLHHFDNVQIEKLLSNIKTSARMAIIVNDLQRSRLAYVLFRLYCSVFVRNDMAREDGLVSILRGFRRRELRNFSEKLQFKNYHIRWKWAFRYQWILLNA